MMQNEETIAATTTAKITLSKTKSLRFPQKLYNMLEQAEETNMTTNMLGAGWKKFQD
jgi:hypothetical protein